MWIGTVGMQEEEEELWHDCQFLRCINRQECVVRLKESGAIVHVVLKEPLDVTRACIVTALFPLDAAVSLGKVCNHKFVACALKVDWPSRGWTSMPPPARYQRYAAQRRPPKRSRPMSDP